MKRLAVVALLLWLPPAVAAQSVVGYWGSQTSAVDRSTGQSVLLWALIRFGDSTFVSILKSDDGSGTPGSSATTHGDWELRPVFGHPALCVRREAEATGPCHPFAVEGDVLTWGGISFQRMDSTAMDIVAPELTRGQPTYYPVTPADDSALSVPQQVQPVATPHRVT